MNAPKKATMTPWAWIPSLYFAEGLPNMLVALVSVVVYKNLGLSNTKVAAYTSLLYLPWVFKPLWSPVVDGLRTRRWWIWSMQLLMGAGLAAVALALQTPYFLPLSLGLFWVVAFCSATHDIGADGFYILANSERQQAAFSGVRSVAFNLARIFATGTLIWLAGHFMDRAGNYALAWAMVFAITAVIFLGLALYHRSVLPEPAADLPGSMASAERFLQTFLATFGSFFRKPGISRVLGFLLLYRLGEAQLLKMVQPFLLGSRDEGGLALTNQQLSVVYGTAGVLALIAGGLLGGWAISRRGLKAWLWPMALIMHLPDAVFLYLAYTQPQNLGLIGTCVAVEQFGYGFGFAAYMLYMIHSARGEHATAHYAICTGFMALGLMLPGAWSGWLQSVLGYQHFFAWVLVSTIPSFVMVWLIPVEAGFGKKG